MERKMRACRPTRSACAAPTRATRSAAGVAVPQGLQPAQAWVVQGCTTAGIGCLECKQPVIEAVQAQQAGWRERAEAPENPKQIHWIMEVGTERARTVARETMREVRDAMGLTLGWSALAQIHITDIESAINWWRERPPSPDGITACAEVRALAEVYALMVYHHETECDEASMPAKARDAWLAWYATTPDAPCIAICSTSQGDAVCKGCGRTFDEVQHWPADDAGRKARRPGAASRWKARPGASTAMPSAPPSATRRAPRPPTPLDAPPRSPEPLAPGRLRVGQIAVLAVQHRRHLMVRAMASALDLAALAIGIAAYISVFVGLMGVVLGASGRSPASSSAPAACASAAAAHQAMWLALALRVPGCACCASPDRSSLSPASIARAARRASARLPAAAALALPGAAVHGATAASTSPSRGRRRSWRCRSPRSRSKVPLNARCSSSRSATARSTCRRWARPAAASPPPSRCRRQLAGRAPAAAARPVLRPFRPRAAHRAGRAGAAWAAAAAAAPDGPVDPGSRSTGFTFMAFFIARIGATPVAGHQIAVNMVSLHVHAAAGDRQRRQHAGGRSAIGAGDARRRAAARACTAWRSGALAGAAGRRHGLPAARCASCGSTPPTR